jgi:hypothetical protein
LRKVLERTEKIDLLLIGNMFKISIIYKIYIIKHICTLVSFFGAGLGFKEGCMGPHILKAGGPRSGDGSCSLGEFR